MVKLKGKVVMNRARRKNEEKFLLQAFVFILLNTA